MKKGLIELAFILDRSGSMTGEEKATLDGFNSMIKEQMGTDTLVTTMLFNHRHEVIHNRVPIEEIREMTEEDYIPEGMTALIDATTVCIRRINHLQERASECERPEKTIFVIITDGLENASRRFGLKELRALIQKQQRKGWEFLFLGANIDAFEEGERLGIRESRCCKLKDYGEGTSFAYEAAGRFIAEARDCESMDEIMTAWRE